MYEYEQELQLMIYHSDYLYEQAEEIHIRNNQKKTFILPFLKLNQQEQTFRIVRYQHYNEELVRQNANQKHHNV